MGKKILIVDDEPLNLRILKDILKDDYLLYFAKNGKEALHAVSTFSPDLVLLDVMMPGMDGYEVCRKMKEEAKTASIPVIFVTALNDRKSEIKGFEVGGVDYISKPISVSVVKVRVKTHLSLVRVDELEKSQRHAVYMLGKAGHYNDVDTGEHIWRMAAYSRLLAEKAGWSEERCKLLELAAPMHDTGKIGVPDAILKKPAKLDAEEWTIMQRHTVIGHGILSQSDTPLFMLAAEIALRHHEKWDGKGYPGGLSGEDIPESARIVALADVFDALTMKRPYKPAWSLEDAVSEINNCSAVYFEPRLVELFEDVLPELISIKKKWDEKEQE